MPYKIIWLPEAVADMVELYNYYAQNSINSAIKIYNGILQDADILIHHPNLAPIEPMLNDFSKTYRSLIVFKGKYKLVYVVENRSIYIIRVWNCKRNPKELKKSVKRKK